MFYSRGKLLACFAMAAFLAGGCSSGRLPELSSDKWQSAPRWPLAPEPARVVRVGQIESSKDIVATRSLVQVIAGEREVRLDRPMDVDVDAAGRLLVADAGLRAIVILDPSSGKTTTVEEFGKRKLLSPVGVSAVGKGWCATDSALAAVACFDEDDEEKFVIDNGLSRPTGIDYDERSGTLWVADTLEHSLVAFGTDGRQKGRIGGPGSTLGRFNFPLDCSPDGSGGVWVVDGLNFRIQHLTADGKPLSVFGAAGDSSGRFARPKGIARHRDGLLFVTDALFDNVQIFDERGRLLLVFGQRGTGPGGMYLPAGLTVGPNGRVFVADSGNHRIQMFRLLSVNGGEP